MKQAAMHQTCLDFSMTMSDNDNAKDDKEIQLHVCSFALVLVGDETCGRLSVRLDALSV